MQHKCYNCQQNGNDTEATCEAQLPGRGRRSHIPVCLCDECSSAFAVHGTIRPILTPDAFWAEWDARKS